MNLVCSSASPENYAGPLQQLVRTIIISPGRRSVNPPYLDTVDLCHPIPLDTARKGPQPRSCESQGQTTRRRQDAQEVRWSPRPPPAGGGILSPSGAPAPPKGPGPEGRRKRGEAPSEAQGRSHGGRSRANAANRPRDEGGQAAARAAPGGPAARRRPRERREPEQSRGGRRPTERGDGDRSDQGESLGTEPGRAAARPAARRRGARGGAGVAGRRRRR